MSQIAQENVTARVACRGDARNCHGVFAEHDGLSKFCRRARQSFQRVRSRVVDAVRNFRHAFFEEAGQVIEIIDVRAHDGMSQFVRKRAVEIFLTVAGVAVFARHRAVVMRVDVNSQVVGAFLRVTGAAPRHRQRTCAFVGKNNPQRLRDGGTFRTEAVIVAVAFGNEVKPACQPPRVNRLPKINLEKYY